MVLRGDSLIRLRLIASTTIIIAVLLYAYLLPYFSPYTDPTIWNQVPTDRPPSTKYIFGTTTLGQDLFWLCSFALRNSFNFGVTTMVITTTIALLAGIVSGYLRGKSSVISTIVIDAFCVIPVLPILVLVSTLWIGRAYTVNFVLLLSIFGWAWPAKIIRSMVLSLRERMYISTAHFSGYTMLDIIIHEYLPHIFGLVFIGALDSLLWVIGMETTLAVFGLTNLGAPSIGTVIFWAMSYQAPVRGIWWWITAPIALLLTFIVPLYLAAREIYMKIL
jgi:peptide/nickel transport system permease protein